MASGRSPASAASNSCRGRLAACVLPAVDCLGSTQVEDKTNFFYTKINHFTFKIGIFSIFSLSILFSSIRSGHRLFSPWLWLFTLLLLLTVYPSAAVPCLIPQSLCFGLCHPIHPTSAVSTCSQDPVLAPGASPLPSAAV